MISKGGPGDENEEEHMDSSRMMFDWEQGSFNQGFTQEQVDGKIC